MFIRRFTTKTHHLYASGGRDLWAWLFVTSLQVDNSDGQNYEILRKKNPKLENWCNDNFSLLHSTKTDITVLMLAA